MLCENCINLFYVQSENENNPVELTEDSIKNIEFVETDSLKVLIHGIKGSNVDDFNKVMREGESSPSYYRRLKTTC